MLLSLIDRLRAPASAPKRIGWLGEAAYAHRGLHGPGVPENSPTAFAYAIEAGMGIECDIQRSGDDGAMVFHDWELDRLTDRSGAVKDLATGELEQIALSENGEHIPTLDTVLTQIGGKVPLLIEVKSKADMKVTPVCLAVRRALEGYRGRHAVMSFDPRVSAWFHRHSPQTVRGLVVTEEGSKGLMGRYKRHASLWHAAPDFLAYDIRDLPSKFAAAQRERGLPVLTWTVRTPQLAERAAIHADAPIAEGEGLPA